MNQNTLKNHLTGAKLCKYLYQIPERKTYIHYRKKTRDVFIIFKGTSTLDDWKKNIAIIPTKDGIHSGFNNHATLCKHELIDIIKERESLQNIDIQNINRVYCIAHSLGASALIILIYEILQNRELSELVSKINMDIVLLGSPKTGNVVFMQKFRNLLDRYNNISIYRYNLKDDYVRYFPPGMTYDHICDDIVLDSRQIKNVSFQHSIQSYINQLENYKLN